MTKIKPCNVKRPQVTSFICYKNSIIIVHTALVPGLIPAI